MSIGQRDPRGHDRSPGRTRRLRASISIAVALALGATAGHAVAARSSELDADQILARASAGTGAPALVGTAFSGATISTTKDVPLRVLVADLAPTVILAAHGRPVLVSGSRRIRLIRDHRYEISRRGRGWRVRDLDGPSAPRVLGPGPVRFTSVVAKPTVLLADPLSRRFRGSLELRPGERRTISVINRVGLEEWTRGAVGGQIPQSWSGAPSALDLAAILERSRALAAAGSESPGWDLTSDDPLYLGVDGELPALRGAADRTRAQVAWTAGAPLVGTIDLADAAPATFTPAPGRPRPVALAPARPLAGARPGLGPRAVELARGQLGTPYSWGGSAPGGFDCSGLVYWVYRQLGITLPRVAEDQGTVGTPVGDGDLQPGDAVFFADSSGYVHHEGIYIGGGAMIHAPNTGAVVRIERIDTGYYASQYAGARRFSATG